MKRNTRSAVLATLLLLSAFAAEAEVKYISGRNGLSNSSVTCIYKDREGYMWLGTWDGLNRYDGTDFEIFRPSTEESSLSSSVVRQIMEDSRGDLWAATERGVDRFDRRTRRFRRFLAEAVRDGVVAEHSFFLAQSPSGELFAGVSGRGLYLFDSSSDSFRQLFRAEDVLRFLHCDSSGTLWALAGSSLLKITESVDGTVYPAEALEKKVEFAAGGQDGNSLWIKYSGEESLHRIDTRTLESTATLVLPRKCGEINCLGETGDKVLVGTASGLLEYGGDGKVQVSFDRTPIFSVYTDDEATVWIGTDMRGAVMVSSASTPFCSITGEDTPFLSGFAVRAFYEEMPDRLWVGTKGNGIALIDPAGRKILARISEGDGISNGNVYALGEGDEVIWVGSDGEGIEYIDKQSRKAFRLTLPEGLEIRSEYAIIQTERNVIWVGTSGFGLFRMEIDRSSRPYRVTGFKQFTKGNGLESNVVYALALNGDEVWAGTRGGGPGRFSMDGEALPAETDPSFRDALNDMTCLFAGKDGCLWMGTSLGIYRRKADGTTEHIETRHINGTGVHGIVEDGNGILWVSTNNGLVRIDPDRRPVSETRFSIEDGLQDNEFSDGAFLTSPYSKRIYFGGIAGLTYFSPEMTGKSGTFPRLVMEGVYIGNEISLESVRKSGDGQEIVIEPDRRSFTLKFATLDFAGADRCEMAYRLEGYSDDWIYLGTSKNIAFSNLPKGDYRLDVRYTNADKVWNGEVYSIRLSMLPHWWETTPAIALMCILALSLAGVTVASTVFRKRERRKIREEEEEKNRIIDIHEAKLRFFTNIAHEFSNSLTLIYGPCKELQKMNSMPSGSRKYLEYIESNSSRMLSLIQQLISFRRAETGHLNISPEEVDIRALIGKIETYFKGKLEEKGMKLVTRLGTDGIRWVTDRDSFEKIVFNLLSNATKYTPNGGEIMIECDVADGKLRTAVTNYGVGIPKEKREAIFDRFEVLDRFESDIRKGKVSNGIGLSMCKTLVELMEGKIWIESDGNTYTTFCFSLPMLEAAGKAEETEAQESAPETAGTAAEEEEAAEDSDGKEEQETAESGEEEKRRILVVDDDPGIRHFVRSLLGDRYSVSTASDGEDALRKMESGRPDLVISDVVMPVMDGFRLLRSIRENEVFKHIPVILLTSENSEDNRRLGLDRGADAFVGKPFNPDILKATVANFLGRNEALLRWSNSAYSALDTFRGHGMTKEDKALLTEVTDVIMKNIDNEELCIDFIASQVGISKMQLYRKVKGGIGLTPVEYIKTLRLEKAEKLLHSTTRTIQQIMFDCGFNSKTYFYREFAKKHDGMTPKQFRESSR